MHQIFEWRMWRLTSISQRHPSENLQRPIKRQRDIEVTELVDRAPKRTRISIADLMNSVEIQVAHAPIHLPSFSALEHPLSYNRADLPPPLEVPTENIYVEEPLQKTLVAINPDTWKRRELGEPWWREARAAGATSRELLEMQTARFLAEQGVTSLWDPRLDQRY